MIQEGMRWDVLTQEEYAKKCKEDSEFAAFKPPKNFIFYHYMDSRDRLLIAAYNDVDGDWNVYTLEKSYCGYYSQDSVSLLLRTKTWIHIDDKGLLQNLEKEIIGEDVGISAYQLISAKHMPQTKPSTDYHGVKASFQNVAKYWQNTRKNW